ncbi:hypothetical protein GBAR_LOCUS15356, partial [Geodia barretti]
MSSAYMSRSKRVLNISTPALFIPSSSSRSLVYIAATKVQPPGALQEGEADVLSSRAYLLETHCSSMVLEVATLDPSTDDPTLIALRRTIQQGWPASK